MIQNQNLAINQFLQSKLITNHNHYNHSIKATKNNEPYFSKNIFNRTSKKISPILEPLIEDYFQHDNNKLKTSYNENNIKNYYSKNSHNHSEYVTKYSSDSSDNFPKFIISKRDTIKTKIRSKESPDGEQKYYYKTEENSIRRARSGNYKSKLEGKLNNRYDEKKIRTSYKEDKKMLDIIQTSPSQPFLFKGKYDLDKNDERSNHLYYKYEYKKINLEKTYNKKNSPNIQNSKNRCNLEEKVFSHSINNIHSDIENNTKQIKNFKSSSIVLNTSNLINSKDIHHNLNNIIDNNKNFKDKDNYKYHSITVRSKNKIDKEAMRKDFKKNYNINNNKLLPNNIEKLNKSILNVRKIRSPKTLSNISKKINIDNHRVLGNKENENKDLTINYQNHSLLESINLKKLKQNDSSEKNIKNSNINTFLDSVKIINNKNSGSIRISENKIQKKKPIRISKETENVNNINENKKLYEIKNNIYESKDKKNKIGYDSDICSDALKKDNKNKNKNRNRNNIDDNNIFIERKLDNNKISYIYEKKNKRQKSLYEEANGFNKLFNKDSLNTNIKNDSNNINMKQINESIKKNLGNVIKKIIKKNNKNQKAKKINIADNNLERKEQQSIIKTNYCKTEAIYNNEKKERNMKKSNSNYKLENKEFINKKTILKANKKEYKMEICKVNNITFSDNQHIEKDKEIKKNLLNKSNNSNIIIIINNGDKNKLKRIIKTPKNPKINIKNLINDKTFDNSNNKSSEKNKKIPTKEISAKKKANNSLKKNNSNNIKIKKSIIKKNNNEKNSIKIKKKIIDSINNDLNNFGNKIQNFLDIKADDKIDNKSQNKNDINDNQKIIANDNKVDDKNIIDNKIVNNQSKSDNIINNNIINNKDNIKKNIKEIDNNLIEIKNNITIEENIDKKNSDINDKSDFINNASTEINNFNENNINPNSNDRKIIIDDNNLEKNYKKEPISTTNTTSNLNTSSTKTISNNESENVPQDGVKIDPESFPQDSIPKDTYNSNIDDNGNDNENYNIDNNKYLENIINDKNNEDLKGDEAKVAIHRNIENPNLESKTETSLMNRYNNFLLKKESDEQISKSSNSSQEKRPDYNNNDCSTEEIQEIKPVIQHNIQRKRPVFTLPPSKKRSVSQGKPFNLIHKYYDENFILEDDEEEGFKKYIKFNGDSRNNSKDESRNSINSKGSLCNSNKKSFKKLEDTEEKSNHKNNFDIKIEDNESENNENEENINISNFDKKEKEKNLFKKISEQFYNEDDEIF